MESSTSDDSAEACRKRIADFEKKEEALRKMLEEWQNLSREERNKRREGNLLVAYDNGS